MKLDNIKNKFLGKEIKYFEVLPSTQSYVKEMDKKNEIQEGEIIFAERQTDGVGTHSIQVKIITWLLVLYYIQTVI